MDPVARARPRTRRRADPQQRAPARLTTTREAEAPTAPSPRGRHRARAAVPGALRSLWVTWVPLLLLALGTAMRVRQFLGARSLWLDEALVARSLATRDYVGLVAEPLQGDQAGPVVWLWTTRLSLDLFGIHEKALRLPALVAGILALLLAWRVAKRLLPAELVPVALLLLVLSPQLLYFSNEVKPYSFDVAVCLGLVLLALRVPHGSGPGREVQLLALAGAAAVWTSFASVFVLGGLSLVLVLTALRSGFWKAAGNAVVLSTWVVSLGVAYVAVLHRLADSTVLSTFWDYTFPDGAADLPAWFLRRWVDLTEDPLELAAWPLALALLAYGAWNLRSRGWLLATSAVPLALLAAGLSLYPFASRLAVWAVPLAVIALAGVLPARLDQPWRLALGAAALTAVVAPMAVETVPQVRDVALLEELRPVMEQLAEQRQPDDLVFVDIAAKAPYDYYTELMGLGRDGVLLFATPEEVGGVCNDPVALQTARFPTQRVWVVFAHQLGDPSRNGTREDLVSRITDVTNVSRTIDEFGARAVLFDPDAAEQPEYTGPRNPERCLAVVRTSPPTGTR